MRRSLPVVALFSLLALLLSACATERKETGFPPPSPAAEENGGHGEGGEGEESPEGPQPLTGPIDVVDSSFEPKDAIVKVGATVTWEQSGVADHTVTEVEGLFDSHPDCDNDSTKCMGEGDTFEFTFKKAGEYDYYCVIHSADKRTGMVGTIIVEE